MIWLLLTWLAAPILLLRARLRRAPLRRVLVIQTAKIGDFVATTPVFRALRNELPDVEITALLHPVNVPLARELDSIDRIIPLRDGGYKGWAGKRWLLGVLAEGYDGVLVLSPNLANLLAPLWCGISRRVSVLPDRRKGMARLAWPLLSHGERHRPGRMFRETALQALNGLEISLQPENFLPNEVSITSCGQRRASELLDGLPQPWIGIGIGAGNRMKALGIEQLTGIIRGLTEKTPGSIVLIGTQQDQATAAQLRNAGTAIVDTTGAWPLEELPALLAKMDCFIGVDSGATYLADAAGTPVVDFMGPADASDQRPIGPEATILSSTEVCAPCSHTFDAPYQCPLGHLQCIRHAPLERIIEQALQIVAHRVPNA